MAAQVLPDVVLVRLIVDESSMFLLFAVILSALWVLATFRFSTRGGPGAVVHFLVRGEALVALACDVLNLAIAATKAAQSPTLLLATPLCTPTGTAFFLLNHLSLILHVTTSALSTGVFRFLFVQLAPSVPVAAAAQRLLDPSAPPSSRDKTSSFVTTAAGPAKVPPLHSSGNGPRILASAFGTNPNDIGLTPVRSSTAAASTEAPPTAAATSPTASTRHLVIKPSSSVVSHLTTQLDPSGTVPRHRTAARSRPKGTARVSMLRQVWETTIASNWRAWSMRVPGSFKETGDPLITDRIPLSWLVRCGFVNELVRRFLLVVTPIGYLVLDSWAIYAACYGPNAADSVMGGGRTAFGFTPMGISFRFWVMYSTLAQLLLTAQAMLGLAVLARHTLKFHSIHEAITARTHLVRAWRLCQCAIPFLILMPVVVSRLPSDFFMAAMHAFLMRGYFGWRLALLQAMFKLVLRNPALRRTLAGRTAGVTTVASLRRVNGNVSAAVTPTISRAASANPVSNDASMAAVVGSATSVLPDPTRAVTSTTAPRAAAVLAAADWTRSLARPGAAHHDVPAENEFDDDNAPAVVTLTVPAPGTTNPDSDSDDADSGPRDAPPAAIVRVQALFEENRLNTLAQRRSSGTLRHPGGSANALAPVLDASAADLFLTMDSHHTHGTSDTHLSPHVAGAGDNSPAYATAGRRAPAAAVPEAEDAATPMFIVGTLSVPRSLAVPSPPPPFLHPHDTRLSCEAVAGSRDAVAGSSVGVSSVSVSHEAVAGSTINSHDSLARSYTAARDPPPPSPRLPAVPPQVGGSCLLLPPGADLGPSVSADSDLASTASAACPAAGSGVPAVNVIAPTPRASHSSAFDTPPAAVAEATAGATLAAVPPAHGHGHARRRSAGAAEDGAPQPPRSREEMEREREGKGKRKSVPWIAQFAPQFVSVVLADGGGSAAAARHAVESNVTPADNGAPAQKRNPAMTKAPEPVPTSPTMAVRVPSPASALPAPSIAAAPPPLPRSDPVAVAPAVSSTPARPGPAAGSRAAPPTPARSETAAAHLAAGTPAAALQDVAARQDVAALPRAASPTPSRPDAATVSPAAPPAVTRPDAAAAVPLAAPPSPARPPSPAATATSAGPPAPARPGSMLPAADPASTPTSPRTPPPSHIDRRASNPRRTSVISARSTSSWRSSSSSASMSMYDDALSPIAARRESSSDSDSDPAPPVPGPPRPSVRRASAAKSPSLPDVDESVSSPSMWLDAQADWTSAARRVSAQSAGSASSLGSASQAPGGVRMPAARAVAARMRRAHTASPPESPSARRAAARRAVSGGGSPHGSSSLSVASAGSSTSSVAKGAGGTASAGGKKVPMWVLAAAHAAALAAPIAPVATPEPAPAMLVSATRVATSPTARRRDPAAVESNKSVAAAPTPGRLDATPPFATPSASMLPSVAGTLHSLSLYYTGTSSMAARAGTAPRTSGAVEDGPHPPQSRAATIHARHSGDADAQEGEARDHGVEWSVETRRDGLDEGGGSGADCDGLVLYR